MNRSVTRGLKSLVGSAVLALSVLAWGLPTPKDIEASVQAGQFHQAEIQLREVLKEKPQSARAHYELGQVLAREGKFSEAESALQKARQLEPSLKFAASAQQLQALLDKVSAAKTPAQSNHTFTSPNLNPLPATTASVPMQTAQTQAPTPPRNEPSIPWTPIVLGVGGLAAWLLWRQRPTAANGRASASGMPTPAPQAATPGDAHGFGQSYPAAPNYPGYPAANAPRSGMGSTVGSAVVGGVAGLAAGYALSKVLGGEHTAHEAGPLPTPKPSDDFTFNSPAASQPDFGSFDAGSGDSWDSGSSGSDDW
ncbi:MAG: tetratricopeptide repeat protein [Burkholderiales bacterium]|nr:tetratricopeptide repeat protein [Burkholderiales bacterium]